MSSHSSFKERGATAPAPTTRIEFRSVLRVRPLRSQERDDPIALDALECGTAVAMHPPVVVSTTHTANYSSGTMTGLEYPSSSGSSVVMAGRDVEFVFDRVFASSASQDKVYAAVGQPLARQAMDSVLPMPKQNSHSNNHNNNSARKNTNSNKPNKTNHIVIGIGLANSGTTHTCLAGSSGSTALATSNTNTATSHTPSSTMTTLLTTNNSNGASNPTLSTKRKLDTDGLVPRIVDSLFSQSKHSIAHNQKNAAAAPERTKTTSTGTGTASSSTTVFAVQIRILAVHQSSSTSSSSENGCHLHDLLMGMTPFKSVSSKTNSTLATTTPPPTKRSTTSFAVEHFGSGIQNLASSLLSNNNNSNLRTSSLKKNTNSNSNTINPEPVVQLQQDPVTSECKVTNATDRVCTSAEQARECLNAALTRHKQLVQQSIHKHKLHHSPPQAHLFVQLQPLWIRSRSGRIVQAGDLISVLDVMASNHSHTAAKFTTTPARTGARGELHNRANDAHSAVMQVLKVIQYNNNSNQSAADATTTANPRKIPFLQHPVTMLLQPLFVASATPFATSANSGVVVASVTLLVTASPSHRDYAEKKMLLTELSQFRSELMNHHPHLNNKINNHHRTPSPMMDGVKTTFSHYHHHSVAKPSSSSGKKKDSKKSTPSAAVFSDDADDESSFGKHSNSKSHTKKNAAAVVDGHEPRVTKEKGEQFSGYDSGLLGSRDDGALHRNGTVVIQEQKYAVGYDSGLLLSREPSKTSVAHSASKSCELERANSMSYSDSTSTTSEFKMSSCTGSGSRSTTTTPKLQPMPPPVAPGYKERVEASAPSSCYLPEEEEICRDGQSLLPPPPILTVDFPGVIMPLHSKMTSSQISVLTMDGGGAQALSPTKGGEGFANSDDPHSLDDQPKFSYMKTINKVVHASKQTGRKVMDAVTTIGSSSDYSHFQQRIADLEEENASLLHDNLNLTKQNQKLQQQLDIVLPKQKPPATPTSAFDYVEQADSPDNNSSCTSQSMSIPQSYHSATHSQQKKREPLDDNSNNTLSDDFSGRSDSNGTSKIRQGRLTAAKEGRHSIETIESSAPDQMYDNPLFQHMASMNNQNSERYNKSASKTTRSSRSDYVSDRSNDENMNAAAVADDDRSHAQYDDPLLQHMAMMNNMQ